MIEFLIDAFRATHFRGKARLLNPTVARSGVKQAKVFGSTFQLDLSDFIQRQIYSGTFEGTETRWVRNHLKPGMTFVDAGANVGYWTALAASLVGPKGRIIAFEPSPYAFQRLKDLVEFNDLEQVEAINAGLSDLPGQVELYLGAWGNHTPTMVPHEAETSTLVAVQTLDYAAERAGIDRIDLIKIDVEGFEFRVLDGAKQLLRERRIRAILCEFNDDWLRAAGSSTESLERTFRQCGFLELRRAGPSAAENRLFRLVGNKSSGPND